MKSFIIVIITAILFIGCKDHKSNSEDSKPVHSETHAEKVETPKKKVLSPHTETMAMIGDAHIHIDYASPGVRNRIIFGGLLSYDEVWQAGAHRATWIETNKDLVIAGKTLSAGKYGFFTIPSQEEWTLIFNTHWDQHGKDEYDEKDDVLRFKVKPIISEQITEHLEYKVNKTSENKGTISLSWEKVSIHFPFELNN